MTNAKTLLLVDDHEAEVFPLHILREQAVSSDCDVDLTGGKVFDGGLDFLRIAETAQHFHSGGKRLESFTERFVMLECEHGGGREHGHLFAVPERLECSAHHDFRLAVADVAAEQAI